MDTSKQSLTARLDSSPGSLTQQELVCACRKAKQKVKSRTKRVTAAVACGTTHPSLLQKMLRGLWSEYSRSLSVSTKICRELTARGWLAVQTMTWIEGRRWKKLQLESEKSVEDTRVGLKNWGRRLDEQEAMMNGNLNWIHEGVVKETVDCTMVEVVDERSSAQHMSETPTALDDHVPTAKDVQF